MGLLPKEKVERIILPSTKDKPEAEQEWVDFNTNPLGGDILESAMAGASTSNRDRGLMALVGLIRGWSFVNEAGEPVPIVSENVARIGGADLQYLLIKAAKLDPAQEAEIGEKKDSSSSDTSQLAAMPSTQTATPAG